MEDILENLTEAQQKILKRFRVSLEGYLKPDDDDYKLVKFLRAQNFNLEAAGRAFKKNYFNRITFDVNTILDTYKKHEVARLCEPTGILGFAKNRSLIRYMGAGILDFYGFIMSMSCYDLCMYVSHMMDSDVKMAKDQSLKTGIEHRDTTFIVDFEGFRMQQVLHRNVIEMGIDCVCIMQDCYPEIWSQLLLVNVPKIFDAVFKTFKPFLRAAVLDKMKIADRDSTRSLLLKYIDEDVLPVFLGGRRVDSKGDPKCREFINFGQKVPEELYSQYNRIPLSPADPEVKAFTVRQRSVHNICVPIQDAYTKMRFQLRSENGGIYVTMFYKEFGPNPNDLELPKVHEYLDENSKDFKFRQITVEIRVQAQSTQEDFTITLQWPGIYVIRLSNAHNWFTSRKLMTKIELFPPENTAVLENDY